MQEQELIFISLDSWEKKKSLSALSGFIPVTI